MILAKLISVVLLLNVSAAAAQFAGLADITAGSLKETASRDQQQIEMGVPEEPESPDKKVNALSIISGVPLVYAKVCSGSPVRSSALGATMFLTSNDCAASSSADRKAYASGAVKGVTKPNSMALTFTTLGAQLDAVRDIALAPITGEISGQAVVHPLARRLPAPGEALMVWGYHTVLAPNLTAISHLRGMECAYLGPYLSSDREKTGVTVRHLAKCKEAPFMLSMRGGPVLNGSGEVAGIVSYMEGSPSIPMKGSLVVFSEVTESLLGAPGAQNPITPLPDGEVRYDNLFLKVANAPAVLNPMENEPQTYSLVSGSYTVRLSGQKAAQTLRADAEGGCVEYRRFKLSPVKPCAETPVN